MNYVRRTVATLIFAISPLLAHAIPITPVSVDASTTCCLYNEDNLINNSGLLGGLHDGAFANMWLNDLEGAAGTLTFELGGTYDISSSDIWQYNSSIDYGRGVDGFDIFASTDGVIFSLLQSSSLTVSAGGSIAAQNIAMSVTASHIRFNITSNHGGTLYSGLSEVKFNGDETAVPAPATLALFGLGLAGLGWSRRKKT